MSRGAYLPMPETKLNRAAIIDCERDGGFVKLCMTVPDAQLTGCIKVSV